jgi:hypothetical protein
MMVFMNADEQRDVLVAILEILKEQSIYLHRQRGWIAAVADTIELKTDLGDYLKAHPFYSQPPRRDEHNNDALLQRIDALIQRLNH